MDDKTILYVIRHGTTEDNLKGIFQGSRDIPLGPQGLEQARYLAQRFQGCRLDAVYCSPLGRARKTAEMLCKGHGLKPIEIAGLREVNCGALEGNPGEYNRLHYPEAMRDMKLYPGLVQMPGGESGKDVYERMVRSVTMIAKGHHGERIAIVSHGFAIQMLIGYARGQKLADIEACIVGNASVSIFRARGKQLEEVMINDESHLPEEMRFYVAPNFRGERTV